MARARASSGLGVSRGAFGGRASVSISSRFRSMIERAPGYSVRTWPERVHCSVSAPRPAGRPRRWPAGDSADGGGTSQRTPRAAAPNSRGVDLFRDKKIDIAGRAEQGIDTAGALERLQGALDAEEVVGGGSDAHGPRCEARNEVVVVHPVADAAAEVLFPVVRADPCGKVGFTRREGATGHGGGEARVGHLNQDLRLAAPARIPGHSDAGGIPSSAGCTTRQSRGCRSR